MNSVFWPYWEARDQFFTNMTFRQSFLKWSCLMYFIVFSPFINDTSRKEACDICVPISWCVASDNEQKQNT